MSVFGDAKQAFHDLANALSDAFSGQITEKEAGGHLQSGGVGIRAGYNSKSGLAITGHIQGAFGGAAADSVTSYNNPFNILDSDDSTNMFDWSYRTYVGFCVPTGTLGASATVMKDTTGCYMMGAVESGRTYLFEAGHMFRSSLLCLTLMAPGQKYRIAIRYVLILIMPFTRKGPDRRLQMMGC